MAECRELAQRWGALLHVDAVQTFPQHPVEGADMVSVSAHKIGGPKGVGGLVLRSGVKIAPYLVGGGQEREMRAGTENPALIAGFGAAAASWSPGYRREARDAFRESLDGVVSWTLSPGEGLEGHAHGRIPGVSAESMLIRLDRAGVSASSGAACSSGSLEPSHVLLAMGWESSAASEGLRFTFGPETSVEEAREAARRVREAVAEITSTRR
jgi:cysteine desulfurase